MHGPPIRAGALGLLLLLGLAPLVYLLALAIFSPGAEAGAAALGGSRAAGLLARSLGIAAGAAALALVAGGGAGLVLARVAIPGRRPLLTLLLVLLSLSPYVLALGWLGGRLDSAMASWMLGHPAAVSWVLGTALLPLAAILVYGAARRRPLSPEEAAFLMAGPGRTLWQVVLRGQAPAFLAAGLLVFSIGLADYAVASLLQVPTYPLEVFFYYAGSFQPAAAARACLPLLLCGLLLSAALAALVPGLLLRRGEPSPTGRLPLPPSWRGGATAVLFAVLALTIAPPLLRISFSAPDAGNAGRALLGGAGAAVNSVVLSLLAATIALLLAWPASSCLARGPRSARIPLIAALLLPLFVPPSAFAIAWVELTGWLGISSAILGPLGPALCLAARFGGLAALFLAGVRQSLPGEALEAARLQEGRRWKRWARVEFPQLAPAALAFCGVLVALSVNAAGILVLTVPPGFEVLPLRVDNLLHYGLPEEASVLAVAAALLAAAPVLLGLGAYRFLRRGSRPC